MSTTRFCGYEIVSTNTVPGDGPIQACFMKEGKVFVLRREDGGNEMVLWVANTHGWTRLPNEDANAMLACNCEKHANPGFLQNGSHEEGEVWVCPNCTKRWVHIHDEAEGDAWYPEEKPIQMLPLSTESKEKLRSAIRSLQANAALTGERSESELKA